MPKLSLTDLASLTNETSAIAAINNNNTLVENALENTLSRDGTSPNSMNSNLDMNSYRIQNLPVPIGGTEPIRKNEFDETLAGIQASQVTNGSVPTPVLGNVGKYLKATGIGNYTWSDVAGSGAVSLTNYNETAATAKTTFTISGGYTSTSVFVYLNGVLLEPSEYVASNGTTVVLNSVCAIGDEFRCISFAPFAAITLGALAAKNTVAAGDIDANAVIDTKIATGAVTAGKIGTGAVTYPNIQNVSATSRVLGRVSAGAGVIEEIPIGTAANNLVQLDGSARLPGVDGRQLTNLNTFAAVYQGQASNNPVTWDRGVFDPSSCVTRTDGNTTLTTNISGRWLIETFLVRNLAGTGGAAISSYIFINGANVSQTDGSADNYGYSSLANAYVSGTLGAGTKISAGAAGAGNGGTSNIILRYLGP
jgi:hypothetical protein